MISRILWLCFFLSVTGIACAEPDAIPSDTLYNPVSGSQTVWNSQRNLTSLIFNRSYLNPGRKKVGDADKSQEKAKNSTTTISPLPKGKNPTASINRLVSPYPPKSRSRLKKIFSQLYGQYDQVAAKAGLPQNDLSSAVAVLLSGLYSAYRDVGVNCDEFLALYNQAGTVLKSTKALSQMDTAKKRLLYEQSVMVGLFVGGLRVAVQKQPDAKTYYPNVKTVARKALRSLFKTNPDNIVLTSNGLVLQ